MNPAVLTHIPPALGQKLHHNHMELLGIADSMRLAYACNHLRSAKQDAWRKELYHTQLDRLLAENGPPTRPTIELQDGWAMDDSMSLPHLDRLLESSERLIAERSGKRTSSQGAYRSYFQDVWRPASDPVEHPEFLDFATSSDLVAAVSHYLECIPALSTTLPSGIRFVESNAAFDDQPEAPHDSQLFHMDYYSLPNVYVLVLLRDTTREHGPWTFLPKSTSQRVKEALGYWQHGRGYRLTDEEVLTHTDPGEVIEFTGKRGTVLFIESSGCLHYGSRHSVKPRFQLMLGYTGACRTDFSESFMPPKRYPVRSDDCLLRRLLLCKDLLPEP